ncbi:hypothetical protein CVT25_015097 [Psilocybe cyanescens]|uniref:DUF6699 domain-containing protein n=1 Tax=Psilocybe cyanescens TaxID=93625 RepID=A0A409WS88_PSICY|nr:hypothetical protein CVT25_015097 [Psilocybe cyanescens]
MPTKSVLPSRPAFDDTHSEGVSSVSPGTDITPTYRALTCPPRPARSRTMPLPKEDGLVLVPHPVLCSGQTGHGLEWDFSRRPWTSELSEETRGAPATTPPSKGPIDIRVGALPYGPITVMASQNANFITVWDVVVATHRALCSEALRCQGLVHLQEYNQFLIPQITPFAQREESRQCRYERNEEEVTRAIRSHFGKMTRWSGMHPVRSEENVWILKTGRGEYW